MRIAQLLAALALWLTAACAGAQQLVPVPPLQARVTDLAGMLKPQQRDALENVLREYEARTGSQIAILLVPSTAPEAIEQYSIRVADDWHLGRKGKDDGVILLVAKNNPPALRRLRIEAGRGVQGSLTDAQSKRILQDVIAPHFRQNDFYGGLAAGISAISSAIDKEKLPAPDRAQPAQEPEPDSGNFLLLIFITFIILSGLFSRGGRSRRILRDDGWGSPLGTAAGIILGSGLGRHGRGGGFGGGGFGGGGFSGGGGGFDGGGASGDW